MFGLFRKTSRIINGKAFDFFQKVFKALPDEFLFLQQGLEKGLYRRFSASKSLKNVFVIRYDSLLTNEFIKLGKQFDLKNILILQDGQRYSMDICIVDGLWLSFTLEKPVQEFACFTVDLSGFRKSKSRFTYETGIEKLLQDLDCDLLELANPAEIELDGKFFYAIKDLEDGNYIAIDTKGKVYGLLHDPYKAELIHPSVRQFVEDVKLGKFDFTKYLEGESGYT